MVNPGWVNLFNLPTQPAIVAGRLGWRAAATAAAPLALSETEV
jgi:hypothetical protein